MSSPIRWLEAKQPSGHPPIYPASSASAGPFNMLLLSHDPTPIQNIERNGGPAKGYTDDVNVWFPVLVSSSFYVKRPFTGTRIFIFILVCHHHHTKHTPLPVKLFSGHLLPYSKAHSPNGPWPARPIFETKTTTELS